MSDDFPTPDDLEWDERATSLSKTELERIQATAEKWRTGLGSLAALVTLATAAGAPFLGARLEGCPRYALAVTMGLTLVFLIFASLQGMRASFGYPTKILNTGPKLKKWTEDRIETTLWALACARNCTLIGVALLAVSAGIAYFGSEPEESAVTGIVHTDGGDVCGTITWAADEILVTAADGTVTNYVLADVTGVDYPKKCP